MATRNERRKDRVKNDIPIAQLLLDLGYPVRGDSGDREEQFPCDMHGDGLDNKPSARIYPESNSWYCFACGVARDTIDTVQAKHDLTFMQALDWLEKKYGLTPMSFEPEDYELSPVQQAQKDLAAKLDTTKSFEDDAKQYRAFLNSLTMDRDLPMTMTLRFWEGLDQLCYWLTKELIPETKARLALKELYGRLELAAKEAM